MIQYEHTEDAFSKECEELLRYLALRPGWCVRADYIVRPDDFHKLDAQIRELRRRGYDVRLIVVEWEYRGWSQVLSQTYCVLAEKK